MVQPRLIHPVPVVVERLIRSELLMDSDAREPVHGMRTTEAQTYTLKAQVKWRTKDDPVAQVGGAREESRGYILLRLKDMNRVLGEGERLKRGDRIITIGVLTDVDVYITSEEPMGHYPDQSGNTLIRYWFADRHPVKQQGDL